MGPSWAPTPKHGQASPGGPGQAGPGTPVPNKRGIAGRGRAKRDRAGAAGPGATGPGAARPKQAWAGPAKPARALLCQTSEVLLGAAGPNAAGRTRPTRARPGQTRPGRARPGLGVAVARPKHAPPWTACGWPSPTGKEEGALKERRRVHGMTGRRVQQRDSQCRLPGRGIRSSTTCETLSAGEKGALSIASLLQWVSWRWLSDMGRRSIAPGGRSVLFRTAPPIRIEERRDEKWRLRVVPGSGFDGLTKHHA